MTNWFRTSALHDRREARQEACLESTDLCIRELPFSGKLLLQARGHIDDIRQSVSDTTGQELPVRPNSCSPKTGTNSGITLLWLGPEKWLIILDPDKLCETRQQLQSELSAIPNLLSDVSDARTGFEVSGASARVLLAKVCALDLDAASFGAGHCAQSMLVRVPVLVHQVNDRPAFHIYVDRSMARYTWDWLSDAASEFISGESS